MYINTIFILTIIAIRMVELAETIVGILDLLLRSILFDFQHFVVVFLRVEVWWGLPPEELPHALMFL